MRQISVGIEQIIFPNRFTIKFLQYLYDTLKIHTYNSLQLHSPIGLRNIQMMELTVHSTTSTHKHVREHIHIYMR